MALVVAFLVPILAGLKAVSIVGAILFPDCGYRPAECDVQTTYQNAGFALFIACLVALVFAVAATASTLTFVRLGHDRAVKRALVSAAIAVLIPVLGVLVTYLVLPPLPAR